MKWEPNSIWKWNHTFWRDPWKRCFLKSKLKSNYRTKDKLENSYFKDYACLFQYFTHKNSWYKARKLLWLVLYNKKHTSICRMCQNFTDICIILQRNDSGKWKRKILHYIMGFANSAVSWFSVVHFQDCFFWTNNFFSPLRFWIVGVFMIIFGAVGLAGNILSIFCLSEKYDSHRTDLNLFVSFSLCRSMTSLFNSLLSTLCMSNILLILSNMLESLGALQLQVKQNPTIISGQI